MSDRSTFVAMATAALPAGAIVYVQPTPGRDVVRVVVRHLGMHATCEYTREKLRSTDPVTLASGFAEWASNEFGRRAEAITAIASR